MLLPKGQYRFSASASCDQSVFRGPSWPVTVKIWGGLDQQIDSARRNPQHVDLAQDFVIQSGPEEVLIQCQVQSREMNAAFVFSSLALARIE